MDRYWWNRYYSLGHRHINVLFFSLNDSQRLNNILPKSQIILVTNKEIVYAINPWHHQEHHFICRLWYSCILIWWLWRARAWWWHGPPGVNASTFPTSPPLTPISSPLGEAWQPMGHLKIHLITSRLFLGELACTFDQEILENVCGDWIS